MTAQTPAPKAGGVSALLASLSTVPPPPSPESPVKEDFLAMILQALTAKTSGEEPSTTAQKPKENPSSPPAFPPVPDPSTASMLMGLLMPPLPILSILPKLAVAHKTALASVPDEPLPHSSTSAPAQTAPEAKLAKNAVVEKAPSALATLAPGQPPPATEPEGKPKVVPPLPLTSLAPTPKETEGKTPSPGGTSVAITGSRMNLSSERNEIAGRIEQKLPPQAISAVSSADTGGPSPDGGTKLPMSFSWHEAPSETLAIMDLSAKAASPVSVVADVPVDAPVRTASVAPLERLEQMISREALTVRQIGAQSLGVSLKLDSNTQLFLQLTTTNGLTQAAVHLERGQFSPEDAQWAQLQQSLARQNVELLPMTGGSNMNFQQSFGERPGQRAARQDWSAATDVVQPPQQRQQKEQNRPRKNWESWA